MSSSDNYFEGFDKVVHVDPATGRKRTEYRYTGSYYRMDLDDSKRRLFKIKALIISAIYIIVYLYASFLNTSASKTMYVGMLCLLMLIPILFLVGALYEMTSAKEYMIARKFKQGFRRLRTVSLVLLVLSGWQVIGEIIYMLLHIGKMETLSLEIEYLILAVAETVLMWLQFKMVDSTAIDEIPNEYVDNKTYKAKSADDIKKVMKTEPEIISDYAKELEVAKEVAVEAGKAIMKIYKKGNFEVETKADDSPLTIADKESNAIIVKRLRKEFPGYAILSEEEQDNKERLSNSYCFVVDPLDGTKEFIKKNGEFTVNIALAKDGRSVMGVIYIPATEELYYAAEGAGAYYRNKDGHIGKIRVSSMIYGYRQRKQFRAVSSRSHETQEMKDLFEKYGIDNVVRIGSSIKGCLVAKGDAEMYYRHGPTMEWDTAAMQCIVEQAGGIFKQMDDTEMTYNREDSLNAKGFYAINRKENRLTL